MREVPFTTQPRWRELRPGALAASIRTDSPDGCRVALLGLPDDAGVKLNGGRPGAREGPAAFRDALARYGSPWDGLRSRAMEVPIFDAGDIEPAAGDGEEALLETHERVEAAAARLHGMGLVVVGIGGGHDLTLPTVRALAKHAGVPVGGVNFDAHLDVRQRVGSGMPFRRLIEGGHLHARAFVEVGLGRFANDEADVAWLREQGATLVAAESVGGPEAMKQISLDIAVRYLPRPGDLPAEGTSRAGRDDRPDDRVGTAVEGVIGGDACDGGGDRGGGGGGAAFVSIDIDGIDSAFATGVSAMNPAGLSVAHAAALAEAAGAEGRVRHFDLMELSPSHDVAGRTSRVAAHLFLSFVAGFAERPG